MNPQPKSFLTGWSEFYILHPGRHAHTQSTIPFKDFVWLHNVPPIMSSKCSLNDCLLTEREWTIKAEESDQVITIQEEEKKDRKAR